MVATSDKEFLEAARTSRADWVPMKLSDLGTVARGRSRHRPRDDESLYGGAYPFIQTGDIKAADMYVTMYSQTYNEAGLAQSKLWQPDTLCITIAANIAETAILKIAACFPDSVVGFIADPAKAEVRFIKYYIDTIKLRMQNISRGTTQDNLSLDKLLSFDIFTPPLAIQRKIAAILSAYDDLIENNTRRIALLEAMVQALYREWFVRFRFPSHQSVPLVDSPLGPIPEGWHVSAFTDIADVLSGGTPKTTEPSYWNGSIPFFGPKDARPEFYVTDTEKAITEAGLASCNSSLYPKDTVFITARGTVGKVVMPAVPMAMNQSCYALIGLSGIDQRFLFLLTRESVSQLKKNATGAVFDAIVVDTFRSLNVVHPPTSLTQRFGAAVSPLFESVINLLSQNANLRRTRNLLLPKLVSGEVDVSEVEVEVGKLSIEQNALDARAKSNGT